MRGAIFIASPFPGARYTIRPWCEGRCEKQKANRTSSCRQLPLCLCRNIIPNLLCWYSFYARQIARCFARDKMARLWREFAKVFLFGMFVTFQGVCVWKMDSCVWSLEKFDFFMVSELDWSLKKIICGIINLIDSAV